MGMIRILAMADTHLGFDYPFRPRIERRRRGDDFFNNFDRILEFALDGNIDLIIHGGDLFYRSKIPGRLVDMVFTRLHRIADRGVPVFIVPGNHERSAIPYRLFAEHPGIHFFDHPVSYLFEKNGLRLCLAGFPCERNNVRPKFKDLIARTGWSRFEADINVLCLHQSVDGALTGPHKYMFRYDRDVVNIREIPAEFSAVITGHMHLHQIIENDLSGIASPAPVFYPGSIERTSFAEKDEEKGFYTIELVHCGQVNWAWQPLNARPMVRLSYMGQSDFRHWLKSEITKMDKNAIVSLEIGCDPGPELKDMLRAESLRALLPRTMNFSLKYSPGSAFTGCPIR